MDKVTEDEIAEIIHLFVKERFPLAQSEDLTRESSLLDSGIVDSLGILDLVGFLEERFGIEAQDDDLVPDNFESIDSLVRFIPESG